MYTKRGGVAAYRIVWIGLCMRSVPGVRVLASAVDDSFFFFKVFSCFVEWCLLIIYYRSNRFILFMCFYVYVQFWGYWFCIY